MHSRPSFASALGHLALLSSVVVAGPCDIYASGDTPCVAAHSTTRALYSNYAGPLYQVQRDSDDSTTDVVPLSPGGVADASTQDDFCVKTTCVISVIYDQTGRGNHLTRAPPGGAASGPAPNGYDDLASAVGAPVTLNGHKAYGVFIQPFSGYRNDETSGIATGNEAQGMYSVLDGTHYNGGCCFDYGNAETSARDTGNGHMEAIYFGLGTGYGTGRGDGPWILADLENGLYSDSEVDVNQNMPSITSRFVTAIVKGEPNHWSIRGANAESGGLTTYFSGVRPSNGYNPMSLEGSIILGIGGDNSNWAQGTWYEGVMTAGYPSDSVEDAVQADIVNAGYAVAPLVSGPALTVGESVSFRVTTPGLTTRYITHNGSSVFTQDVSDSSRESLKTQGSWVVRTGLANAGCYSFESKDTPGSFLRHDNYALILNANDGSKLFSEDATYCSEAAFNGQGNSIRSWSYPTRYWRHYASDLYIASNGGPHTFDTKTLFTDDASFVVSAGWA